MTDLLRELDAVVALSEKATQGEWLYRQGTAIVILGQGAGGFDLSACPQPAENAQAIASAVNFIRTHHAEIAEALADARRYRWLRDEAHKEPHTRSIGIYCEWGSNCDLGSIGGTDADVEVDAAIDAHNSAREDGE